MLDKLDQLESLHAVNPVMLAVMPCVGLALAYLTKMKSHMPAGPTCWNFNLLMLWQDAKCERFTIHDPTLQNRTSWDCTDRTGGFPYLQHWSFHEIRSSGA